LYQWGRYRYRKLSNVGGKVRRCVPEATPVPSERNGNNTQLMLVNLVYALGAMFAALGLAHLNGLM